MSEAWQVNAVPDPSLDPVLEEGRGGDALYNTVIKSIGGQVPKLEYKL